jgi:hypothetical protein
VHWDTVKVSLSMYNIKYPQREIFYVIAPNIVTSASKILATYPNSRHYLRDPFRIQMHI